jgi:hypothetical protein
MNRFFLAFAVVLFFISCSKMDEKPPNSNDSLLVKPLNIQTIPESQPPPDTNTGLVVDQARLRTPEHEALLERFTPYQVVNVYHDFKSIRKAGVAQTQIDSFNRAKKISLDELKAILEEGDSLGWNRK